MMASSTRLLAEQKALLCARAELDRTRLAFALHDILSLVAPETEPEAQPSRPFGGAGMIGLLASVFGARKVGRWVRYASWGLTAFRLVRNWRRTR
jgi:hypothetical protein